MHAFYHSQLNQGPQLLSKEESHHMLKVMRLAVGTEVKLLDGDGGIANAIVTGKEGALATVELTDVTKKERVSPEIHLFLAPPKSNDRLDFILEKATELGVASIQFLHCRNSERKNVRIEKLEQKIIAACKQSVNPFFPTLKDFKPLKELNLGAVQCLLFHCRLDIPRTLINHVPLQPEVNLFIGPEGDFNKEEIDELIKKGCISTSLGTLRMRTETAGLAAIIKVQTLFEEG